MATKNNSSEKAVRDYLAYLTDPSEFVDKRLLNELQKKFAKEEDPVKKLALYQQISGAKVPDGTKVENAFIEKALAWSNATGVTVNALIEVFNVPRDILREAGFNVRSGYKSRVKGEAVRACIVNQSGPFTIPDIVEEIGASDAGVRNVIRGLLEEGVVEALPKENVKRGKAPIRYQNI